MSKHRKSPPYARNIPNYSNQSELIICTGSAGWNRAKSKTWYSGIPKVVLPFGDDPTLYQWPVQDRAIMVFDFTPNPEGFNRLVDLSRQLLMDGAAWVLLLSESFPMTRINGREAQWTARLDS